MLGGIVLNNRLTEKFAGEFQAILGQPSMTR